MVRKRKEAYVRDPTVSSDGEEESPVSGISDVIDKEVHDTPAAPAVPSPSKPPLSNLFFKCNYYTCIFSALGFFSALVDSCLYGFMLLIIICIADSLAQTKSRRPKKSFNL